MEPRQIEYQGGGTIECGLEAAALSVFLRRIFWRLARLRGAPSGLAA
jgi:hypothetical protein